MRVHLALHSPDNCTRARTTLHAPPIWSTAMLTAFFISAEDLRFPGLIEKIFAAAGLKPPLKPTNEREFRTPARRPKYSALSNAKAESLDIAPMPSLDQAIYEYLASCAARTAV